MSRLIWYPGHDLLLEDIVRAEGCHLFDSHGNRYLDLESGVWCTSVGHGHPRVTGVITGQLDKISHAGFNYSSPVVEETAREVLALLGMEGGRCVFLCSGSESVEYAVRVAQMIDERPLLMTMADSYFGAYGSAKRRDRSEWYDFDWMECADCPRGGKCGDGCPHWDAVPFDDIGGFMLEPGSSSGLVRFPTMGIVERIAGEIRSRKGLVLVNEVTTGMGRTGRWFGFEHYGLSPDIVSAGKGIGNGYPVSVTAFSAEASRRLGDTPVPYAQSHQNDPLGAAVLGEVIKIIKEEDLIARSLETAAILKEGLEGIKERTGVVKEVRARGLMAAVDIDDDEENSLSVYAQRELLQRGYVVGKRPGINTLRFDPCLAVDKGEIRLFLETLEEVLGGYTK